MKKMISAALILALVFSLCACGFGISQEEYDDLAKELEDVKTELSETKSTLETANTELTAANVRIAELEEELEEALTPQMYSPDGAVFLYEDDYVKISYLGCEVERDQMLVFYVVNKTDAVLSFQSDSMSINGESLGYISGSDKVAAQSNGKIKFSTEEIFPTLKPDTITGDIKVIDFSKTVFGKQSYDVTFVNVDTSDASAEVDEMPLEEAAGLLEKSLAAASPSAVISTSVIDDTIIMDIELPGTANSVKNIQTGEADSSHWDTIKEAALGLYNSNIQSLSLLLAETPNHRINFISDEDGETIFLTVENGEITFDIMA